MQINRILTKTFLICLIYCLSILPASAQTSVLFSTDNQISSSLINDIYQDQKGFIWIATEYGLNLFDGNKFVTFHHIENDSTSLRNDYVFSVFEDSKNNLWVASLGGLMKYNHNTNSFTEVPLYINSTQVTTIHTCSNYRTQEWRNMGCIFWRRYIQSQRRSRTLRLCNGFL